jgi:hypothetical protein
MYAAIHDFEPERFVSTLRVEGIQPGVGCHLRAAFVPSPVLGCGNKFCSDSPSPVCRRNIPSLDVTGRTGRVATVRV